MEKSIDKKVLAGICQLSMSQLNMKLIFIDSRKQIIEALKERAIDNFEMAQTQNNRIRILRNDMIRAQDLFMQSKEIFHQAVKQLDLSDYPFKNN